jgi:hypothetical protein
MSLGKSRLPLLLVVACVALASACATPQVNMTAEVAPSAPGVASGPASLSAPLPGARQANPELSARTIVERATQAAGGETWRRPQTLLLEGHAIFYAPDGRELVNQRHLFWRVYPEIKPDAHAADGKVRIESWRDGQLVTFLAFDGARTYGPNGALPPLDADRQWAENFGFGVIRFALDPDYALARKPDDLVDGHPVYRIEVTGPSGDKTLFGIGIADYAIRSVGFATPRGYHERIYSDFWRAPGLSWTQPGRIRLTYDGVKQNELVWTRLTLNQPMDDRLFDTPPVAAGN